MNVNKNTFPLSGKKHPFFYFLNRHHVLPASFSTSLLVHLTAAVLFFTFMKENSPRVLVQNQSVVPVAVFPNQQDVKPSQVVDQHAANRKKPEQTSYLSEYDQAVEKETRAMVKDLFFKKAQKQGALEDTQNEVSRFAEASSAFGKDQEALKSLESKIYARSLRELSSLSPKLQDRIQSLLKNNPAQNPGHASLKPNNIRRVQGEHFLIPDYLPGVELGSHTMLNTSEFRFYSFLSRVKEQIYWRWVDNLRNDTFSHIKKHMFPGASFITVLWVALSPDGEVSELQVLKGSGVEALDTAAHHSFLAAGSFPNPPRAMVGPDGVIELFQSFIIHF